MENRRRLTDHHQVPESYGGTRRNGNIFRMKEHKHAAFHLVFDNRTFIGQILALRAINATSLSEKIKRDVAELVNEYKGEKELYAYKNGVLVPERFLAAQERFRR